MRILLVVSMLFIFASCTKKEKAPETSSAVKETQAKAQDSVDIKVQELEKEFEEPAEEAPKEEPPKKKETPKVDPQNVWKIKLKNGTVVIHLRPDLAPKHAERIRSLTKKGFYDGLKFHRVIDGFMAQTGDPNGNGSGGSDLPDLQSEFSKAPFERGVVGMARAASPHSANSQFFIMLDEAPHLNGAYTVVGKVVSGMSHVDQIKKGDPRANGSVEDPDKMIKVTIGQ